MPPMLPKLASPADEGVPGREPMLEAGREANDAAVAAFLGLDARVGPETALDPEA